MGKEKDSKKVNEFGVKNNQRSVQKYETFDKRFKQG